MKSNVDLKRCMYNMEECALSLVLEWPCQAGVAWTFKRGPR